MLMAMLGLAEDGLPEPDRTFLEPFVEELPPVQRLPQRLRKQVLSCFTKVEFAAGAKVITAGNTANRFFIVGAGTFLMHAPEINRGRSLLNTFGIGSFIGESSFYRSPTARFPFDVKCSADGHLFMLALDQFRSIVSNAASVSAELLPGEEDQVAVLEELMGASAEGMQGKKKRSSVGASGGGGKSGKSTKETTQLAKKVVSSGKALVGAEGVPSGTDLERPSDGMLVVISGTVKLQLSRPQSVEVAEGSAAEKPTIAFSSGEIVGEAELARLTWASEPSVAATPSASDAVVLRLGREAAGLLPQRLVWVAANQTLAKLLRSIEAFQTLAPDQIEDLCKAGRYAEYAAQDAVSMRGTEGAQMLYVIVSGVARITRPSSGDGAPELLGRLGMGEHFGAINIIDPSKPRATDVHADTPLRCFTFERDAFGSLLDVVKHSLARELANRRWVLENRNKVSLRDLEVMRTIGQGTFGRVKLVMHKPSQRLYALKCLRKVAIEEMSQVQNVITEVKLLSTCSHPFILKLAAAFQSDDQLYMVLEFIQGGEVALLLEVSQPSPLALIVVDQACRAAPPPLRPSAPPPLRPSATCAIMPSRRPSSPCATACIARCTPASPQRPPQPPTSPVGLSAAPFLRHRPPHHSAPIVCASLDASPPRSAASST